jgi:hypothetical protein
VRNPLAELTAPLASLAEGASVLPATGGAQEYLQRFDLDEHYDRIAVGDDRKVSEIRERPGDSIYVETPPSPRPEDHCFQLFLDGAARTTFLGTLVADTRATPVVLAQIGAAAIRREAGGALRLHAREIRFLLVIDRGSVTERVWDETARRAAAGGIDVVDAAEKTPYTDNALDGATKEPRSRAAHKANWQMRMLEFDLLESVLPDRPAGSWAITDGSLGKEFYKAERPDGYVGVVKNFSKDLLFDLPVARGAKRSVDLYTLLARLKVGHRTAVFGHPEGTRAFWYVRLRGPVELDYPLMGVVKVEVPLASGEYIEGELIDRLSRCLVAERTVAPHGRDVRWHAHLYPISMAEQAIRTGFVSQQVLQAAVRWPDLNAVAR